MIIQQPGTDGRCFAIRNIDHARFAGALARQFGNDMFQLEEPRSDFYYLVDHHDEGWKEIDDSPPLDESSGMPFHLIETPFQFLIDSGRASPDWNEKHSPLCGLLSSMHTYGLYHGRYGLSDAISMEIIPGEWRETLTSMLQQEYQRQQRLQEELDSDLVFYFYKLLQFFDACALYFNFKPAGDRGSLEFSNVPLHRGQDTSIRVTEVDDYYVFDPYPFIQDELEFDCRGRYFHPDTISADRPYTAPAGYSDSQRFRVTAVSH